ncbi:hypothetical protein [Saccharothrix variisporea]|uniref:Arsenate reductase n=1 Tax=Saccharothrix variisporea TaxID=543527 RepID=A0A495X542_9PSEU|nr:hypothetical protein [Saccharothrix variisporea]RKT69120.1 hypothetical protein DFJ66_2315 [Saccharothrix variisporea]
MSTDPVPWTPLTVDACTLPTAEQPLREKEFDDLFAASARSVERLDPTCVRVTLDPAPEVAARTAHLMARETGCCSFFTFALTTAGDGLRLDIRVPHQRVAVLEALAARVRP